MERIVAGVDASERSTEAAVLAARLAKALGAQLTIVHVRHMPAMWAPEVGSEVSFEEYADAIEKEARSQVEDALRDCGVEWDFVSAFGDPADQLEATAAELGAAMIVIGSQGKGAVQRLLLGSVSTRLVHHATRPVLVVRGADGDAEDDGPPQSE